MKSFVRCFVRSLFLAAVIIGVGYLAVHFFLQDPQKLDVTLFALGAISIVIFLPHVLSRSRSGAMHTPKVIFRKVDTLEQKDRETAKNIFTAVSYVIAGVLTWLYGWFVY